VSNSYHALTSKTAILGTPYKMRACMEEKRRAYRTWSENLNVVTHRWGKNI